MNNININCIFILMIFISMYQSILTEDLCSPNYNCEECAYCGGETKDYKNCSYSNIFCRYYVNYQRNFRYSSYLKNELINYFRGDSELNSFCGEKEYTIDTGNKEINEILLNSEKTNFPQNKLVHCNYKLNINKGEKEEEEESNVEFKVSILKNNDSKEARTLKFNIYLIINSSGEEEIKMYDDSTIRENSLNIYLYNSQTIEFFIDFVETNYNHPDEILEIVVTTDGTGETGDKNDSLTTIFSSIGGTIVGIGLLILFGYCCCCVKEKKKDDNDPIICNL